MTVASSATPYAHWMLREIFEQPDAIRATLDRYLVHDGFHVEQCAPIERWLQAVGDKIVIAASGSSRHAAMVAELLIEDASGIPVDVEYASEYTYRAAPRTVEPDRRTGVLVVSQSGETADTLAALRRANAAGRRTLAITNVPTSTMAQEAGVSFPTVAGRERAVPATKSFTTQLINLYLLSLLAAKTRGVLHPSVLETHLRALHKLPSLIEQQLTGWETQVHEVSARYMHARSFLFLGRGVHYPIAREGALKLKESSYLHAEGYPSGELKHGPNAIVAEDIPLVMLATVDHADTGSVERYERVLQLIEDMRRQGANILAIANHGDAAVAALATNVIGVSPTAESLLPICEVIPLQMFAYFMAVRHGIDVDRPRNLVKAVVEE